MTNGTSVKAFIDSNVLIYAHDVDAGRKHEIARDVLRELWEERSGVLSAQVLHEFYVNVTRKIPKPLPKAAARGVVGSYAPWCIDPATTDVHAAFQLEDEASIGFWDALIVAAAVRSGAKRILSEDLNDSQVIAGVTVVNPFRV